MVLSIMTLLLLGMDGYPNPVSGRKSISVGPYSYCYNGNCPFSYDLVRLFFSYFYHCMANKNYQYSLQSFIGPSRILIAVR